MFLGQKSYLLSLKGFWGKMKSLHICECGACGVFDMSEQDEWASYWFDYQTGREHLDTCPDCVKKLNLETEGSEFVRLGMAN
jgi:hypothetical protein